MKEEQKCPCCPNHCDISDLNCDKGRNYFSTTNNMDKNYKKDESIMTSSELAIHKIRQCGHCLHHGTKLYDLNFLTESEKNNLITILSKCLDNWNNY